MVRLLWLENYNMMMWCGLLKFWEKGCCAPFEPSVRQSDDLDFISAMNGLDVALCRYEIWNVELLNGRLGWYGAVHQPHSTILGWYTNGLFEFWLRFWKKTKERLEPLMWEMGVDERYIQYWPLSYVREVNSEFYQYVLTRKRHNQLFIKLAP